MRIAKRFHANVSDFADLLREILASLYDRGLTTFSPRIMMLGIVILQKTDPDLLIREFIENTQEAWDDIDGPEAARGFLVRPNGLLANLPDDIQQELRRILLSNLLPQEDFNCFYGYVRALINQARSYRDDTE